MSRARRISQVSLLSVICLSCYVAFGQTRGEVKPVLIERPPLRMIKDSNPSFSSVAVNSDNNMLVVTDENLFQVLEYDRRENTPSTARFTEPKRVISGPNTYAEMMCGVYIDPKTLDIYVLNNDTQNWLPVFATDARGNAKPSRVLAAPHGTFGIAVNEDNQEMFLTVQHQNAVYVYRKGAVNEEKPLRVLRGNDTQLEDPHGIAIDTKNNLIFVSNYGNAQVSEPATGSSRAHSYGKFEAPSVTVYPLTASGNAKPLWTIEGPKTLMNWPTHIALHQDRQELFVANDADDSVLVFSTGAKGDVSPIRVIKGAKTGIKNPPGIALDTKLNELYVANMGKHSITVFPVTANGDVAPLRTIRGGPADSLALNIGNPGAVGYDTKRDQILVPN
jgi:DNA-binding beta-propeller fold protein YncE